MVSPKIYLAIDNCFASKRWTKPSEWMDVIQSLGVNYVEASADNECDPLYTTPEYLADWVKEIKSCSEKTGVKVANLYSGHGTYATLGLAHTDIRLRDRILYDWLLPMVDLAKKLEAGLGFYCHAFSDHTLQSYGETQRALEDLYDRLSIVAEYGKHQGAALLGVEQMYSPQQIPVQRQESPYNETLLNQGFFEFVGIFLSFFLRHESPYKTCRRQETP